MAEQAAEIEMKAARRAIDSRSRMGCVHMKLRQQAASEGRGREGERERIATEMKDVRKPVSKYK